MKRLLIAGIAALALLLAVPAARAAWTTDYSDLWWVPSESGWGIQFVETNTTIFATMYVYGPSGQPTFYSATLEKQAGVFIWSGELIATTGPWFGAASFDPSAITRRVVGTMTFSTELVNSGTLTYSIDGVSVTKSVERALLKYDNWSGTYPGSLYQANTGCTAPEKNVTSEESTNIVIARSNFAATLSIASQSLGSCTYTGTFSQAGHLGRVTGTYSCSGGDIGTFTLFEAVSGWFYLTARFSTTSTTSGCKSTGYFAGIRHGA
jgi:hypothetical protein